MKANAKKHTLTLLTVLLLAPLAALHAADAIAAKKPNIIFILTDDQGYGDVGRHGHPLLKTPNLDALHDQSVRFEKFYVSPSCSPTRAALMTGMHEFRNGVTPTTITTLSDLRRECKRIVSDGYSTDFAEADEGIHCIAGPIRDGTQRMVGTLWITGPAKRLPKAKFRELGMLVKAAGDRISRRIGEMT